MRYETWVVVMGLWVACSLMACRSAVKDFYDPLAKACHCGGAAGSTAGTGGGATGGQTFSTSGQAGAGAGGSNTGGQGGECP